MTAKLDIISVRNVKREFETVSARKQPLYEHCRDGT